MWAIYSAEDFPKFDQENNCQTDYRQALGVQVILHAGKWTPLQDFYSIVRYQNWMDAAGEGTENIVTGRQIAERLAGDFRLRGIGCCDMNNSTDEQRTAIAKACDEQNMKYRRMFIDRFEQQFRVKSQGGPGRWVPTAYEDECYRMHGLKPPDVVQRAPEERKTEVQIIESKIDPEMIAALVAAEVAKLTAPTKAKG